ncbi:prion-inhibition and propagation-domain-containing protein [Lasiosphaeria hispida]|uniref:Prion-inhibition and propagation-domain-containing protein n=1 Tax=Lasiosphaeria hispida TaxID=260671 RepID=A0AAJ0MF82_9PEZI|nr:prion-inhibition and propagation-domain-containing protein [Lasiosphaeria hispida]
MSGLEVPAFLIGLAGLFSSCVDAFGYFKLAQHADKDVEVILLRLDIQKARLLIWGENVGILSASHQNPRLLDAHLVHIVRRILTQIENLLTDSEKLRASYGAQALNTPLERVVDYISSKSLVVFRTSATRFWARNSAKLGPSPQLTRIARIKWAVYEKEKFQELINTLSDLIDTIFEFSNTAREIQDRIIIEDIESNLDISQLAIIEEATESSYSAYSKAAASVRAATETGTVDRRTLEERLRDTGGTSWSNFHNPLPVVDAGDLDLLWSEIQDCPKYAVLTSRCRKLQTQDPCDIRQIGSQAANTSAGGALHWDISSRNRKGGNTLCQLIDRLIDIRKNIEAVEYNVLGEVLKAQDYNLTEAQTAYMEKMLPLLNLFIYCSPCVCLIHTALSISQQLSSPFIKIHVRPDDRMISSCCNMVDRTLGLRSTLEQVRGWESEAAVNDSNPLASFLDTVWLDRRLDRLNYELPYIYREEYGKSPTKRILIIGEADYIGPLIQRAPGRIPIPMDIWKLDIENRRPTRTLFSRFIESQFTSLVPAPRPPVSEPLTPSLRGGQHQAKTDDTGFRPSSPLFSDSKRRKVESRSFEQESGGNSSEDRDMDIESYFSKSSN